MTATAPQAPTVQPATDDEVAFYKRTFVNCDERVKAMIARIDADRRLIAELRRALQSIAANTCCDRCQEAALVARTALESKE